MRRRRSDSQAFQLERCGKDPAGDAEGNLKNAMELACGEGEADSSSAHTITVPETATGTACTAAASSCSSPVSADCHPPRSQTVTDSPKDAPTVGGKRSGAVPRNPLEVCKRMGFVVTRKTRTLSLDDFPGRHSCPPPLIFSVNHNHQPAAMKMVFSSKDDTCLPFIPDCSITQLKKGLILSADRPTTRLADEERRYDLVGAPGPKFLLLRLSSQKRDLGESFNRSAEHEEETSVSVPFKWEEAPGKPKMDSAHKAVEQNGASLKLPPRLLVRSFTGRKPELRTSQSVNPKQGYDRLLKCDPVVTSPTSTLAGPELTGSDSTSDSSAVESETVTVSDAESGTMVEEKRRSFAARLLHSEWLGIRRRSVRRYRGSGDQAEMWDDQSVPSSGQLSEVLRGQPEEVPVHDVVVEGGQKKIDVECSEECGASCSNWEEIPDLTGGGEIMYCGCTSPRIGSFSPSSRLRFLRSNSEKQKRWVVKRIRRSSRLFQMFFVKAVKQAIQPRRRRSPTSKFRFNTE